MTNEVFSFDLVFIFDKVYNSPLAWYFEVKEKSNEKYS